MRTSAFVANPAGDADITVQIKAFVKFCFAAGKAVHDNITQVSTILSENGDKIFMSIALVQKKRQAALNRDLNLLLERRPLRIPRREITEIVQAGFPHRDHTGLLRQFS